MLADVEDVVLLARAAVDWLSDELRRLRKMGQGARLANGTAATTPRRMGHLLPLEPAAGGNFLAREVDETDDETSPLAQPASIWRPGRSVVLVAAVSIACLLALLCLKCYESVEPGDVFCD
jgi:hypothetical protein